MTRTDDWFEAIGYLSQDVRQVRYEHAPTLAQTVLDEAKGGRNGHGFTWRDQVLVVESARDKARLYYEQAKEGGW